MISWEARLGAPRGDESYDGEQTYLCPLCEGVKGTADRGYHLRLNRRKGKFFCHRCSSGGTVEYLAEILGADSITPSDDAVWSDLDDMLSPMKQREVEVCTYPVDYIPMLRGTDAHRYLTSRGVSDEDIEYFRIGFSVTPLSSVPEEDLHMYSGSGRVIIPDLAASGEIQYWVSRSYVGHKAKYKNARMACRDKVLDLDRASRTGSGYLLVCEGPLDAVVSSKFLDRSSVATYGKAVTDDKLIRIAESGAGTIYVCLDPDASDESSALCRRLALRGCSVYEVHLPEKEDPASLGPRILDYIDTAVEYSDF